MIASPLWSLAIHGGSGQMRRASMTAKAEAGYRAGLAAALDAGRGILACGGSALDAVEAAVMALEDDPQFNAGRGAVFTADGNIELDAAIMDGASRAAGAVAGVTRTRNPVSLARAVMATTPHVLLGRDGADRFAVESGLPQVEPDYFHTSERWQALQAMQAAAARGESVFDKSLKYGTVGAVARDSHGHLAAATSTGGLTGKRWGRIGDSPLIGAGCYANDATVAVSCTGTGEAFMRGLAAHDVSALMAYAGLSLEDAANRVVMDKLPTLGGRGGLIAVSATGEVALPFNTEGMYRGYARVGEPPVTAIYGNDSWPR